MVSKLMWSQPTVADLQRNVSPPTIGSCHRDELEQQTQKLKLLPARSHCARKEIYPSWQSGSGDWSDGAGIQCALFQGAIHFKTACT